MIMVNSANYLGKMVLGVVNYIGELSLLLGQIFQYSFIPPFKHYRVLTQAKRVGLGSFFIAAVVAFFIGMIIALQMAYQMVKLSAEIYIPNVIAVSMARELGPVLTALIVAGRVGAGITAEISSMTVTEQVDALRAFAVNPIKYLVIPRFLALVIMLPMLTILADLIGILGGFVICVYKLNLTPAIYFTMVMQSLSVKDIITGLVKTIFFGGIIAMVGCHQGLNVKGGADGVGRATTVSVVISFIMIIIADCLFTTMFYFIFKV